MRLVVSGLSPSRRATLALALGWAALGFGHDVDAQIKTPDQPPLPLPEPDETARLLENLLTRMGVKVNVGARRETLFVIDTGAERTAISDRLAAELQLAPGPAVLVHGVTAAEMVRTVELPGLDFSGRHYADLRPPVFPYEVLAADGLLGLDVLSRFRLTLDLRQRRASLVRSDSDTSVQEINFGFASRIRDQPASTRTGRFGQLILTNVQVDSVNAVAFIDSGAQYSIGNLALMRAVDARFGPAARPQVRVYGVIGQSLVLDSGVVSSMELARRQLGATPLLFGDLHAFKVLGLAERPALLLGADILTRFSRITLDYGQSHIAFGDLLQRPPPPALRSP